MDIRSAEFIRGVVGSHNVIVDERPQYAFIGRSNVGKSSLINMLTQRERLVIASSKPGKTSQINYFLINDALYFVDLPGYGYAVKSQKAREKLRKMILWYFISGEVPVSKAVVIVDVQVGMTDFDEEMCEVLRSYNHPYIIAVNKIDKANQSTQHKSMEAIKAIAHDAEAIIPVSAKTGRGREKLLNALTT